MNLMQSQQSQKSPSSMTPGFRLYFVGARRDERNTVRAQIGCFLRKSKGKS